MQQPNYPTPSMGIGKHQMVDSHVKRDGIKLKNNDYTFYQEDKVRPVRNMDPYTNEALTMDHID